MVAGGLKTPWIPKIAVPNRQRYSSRSGIGRHILAILERWRDRVSIIDAEFSVVPLPAIRNYPRRLKFADGIPDAILLPQMHGTQALPKHPTIPAVVVVHDFGILDCPADRNLLDPVSKWIIYGSIKGLDRATRIITPSRFTAQRIAKYRPHLAGRISVVPNGVQPVFRSGAQMRSDDAKAFLARCLGRGLGFPLLVTVGTEAPRKNLEFLVELIKELKTWFPAITLLKIGPPGEEIYRRRTLKVPAIFEGVRYIPDVSDDTLCEVISNGRLRRTTDYGVLHKADIIYIAVAKPLTRHKGSDLSFIEDVSRNLASIIHPGLLVVLESTTYPGTTEEILVPLLTASQTTPQRPDFFVEFWPESVDPSNAKYRTENTSNLVTCINRTSTELTKTFYEQCIAQAVPVSSM